jgi:motility quorum-sensing regulator/GCU-specific mRNA interferase toxin
MLAAGKMKMTYVAYAGAALMNLEWHGVRDILLNLEPADFYKSMTTYEDHRVWQTSTALSRDMVACM